MNAAQQEPSDGQDIEHLLRSTVRPATPDIRSRVAATLAKPAAIRAGSPLRLAEWLLGGIALTAACLLFAFLLQRARHADRNAEHNAQPPVQESDWKPKTLAGDDELAATIEALLRELDDASFEVREAAQKKLVALGPKALPLLQKHAKDPDASEERLHRIHDAMAAVTAARQAELHTQAQASIDEALRKVPESYQEPDPAVLEKLQQKHAMKAQRVSFREGLSQIEKQSGVTILLDAQSEEKAVNEALGEVSFVPGTYKGLLDVFTMTWGRDYLVRGSCVVITTQERAAALRMKSIQFSLPRPAEWSEQQTRNLAEMLVRFPIRRLMPFSSDIFQTARVDSAKMLAAGRVGLVAEDWALQEAEKRALQVLGDETLPPAPAQSEWFREQDGALDKTLTLRSARKPVSELLRQIARSAKVALVVHVNFLKDGEIYSHEPDVQSYTAPQLPKGTAVQPEPVEELQAHEKPCRDLLLDFCLSHKVVLGFHSHNMRLWTVCAPEIFHGLNAVPAFYDLRPALKAGVKEADLLVLLKGLLREACLPTEPLVVRETLVVSVDEFTSERIAKVLKEASATGKLPAAPPAPWFFKTFPKR